MDANLKQCTPTGDLTIFEVAGFKESLGALLSGEGPVMLDLSQVTHVDSSALQLILAVLQTERLSIVGASDELKQNLQRMGGRLGSVSA